jgi:starch synthase
MPSTINDVWLVSREMEGIAGAGGVKDATRQLLIAIARQGTRATLVMPRYTAVDRGLLSDTGVELTFPTDYTSEKRSTHTRIYRTEVSNAVVFLVDAPCYAEKESIYCYTSGESRRMGQPEIAGTGYYDFFEMNVVLQKAALELIQALNARPDLIHCQDAHTAFIPAMMRLIPRYQGYFAGFGSGITIHNAGPGYHQEVYDVEYAQAMTELPRPVIERGTHRNGVYPFLVGGYYAGFINTVSENYAREIMEAPADDEQTVGIGAAFRERGIQLVGVTNGIDPAEYDPTKPDEMDIAAAYNPLAGDMAGKAECRRALVAEINQRRSEGVEIEGWLDDAHPPRLCPPFGGKDTRLQCPDGQTCCRPLVTMISRLTAQKGVDRFIQAIRQMLEGVPGHFPADPDVLFLVLGTGDSGYLKALRDLARDARFDGRIAVAIGYGPSLARRIYAAGDFFVNPAAFEPCGLTDYMAQLMGNVPIVHLVGGLVKVQDGETGYGYYPHTAEALAATLRRAIATFREHPDRHLRIVQQAIRTIHERYTWDRVLQYGYMPLYEQAVSKQGS